MTESWEEPLLRKHRHIEKLAEDIGRTFLVLAAIVAATVAIISIAHTIKDSNEGTQQRRLQERTTRIDACKTITEEAARGICISIGGK